MSARSLVPAVVAVLAAAAAPAVGAQEAELRFDLPAGPALQSIPEFARQSTLRVLARARDLDGVSTKRVAGSYTASEALRRLVAGTGLVAQVRDNGTVLVSPAPAAEGAPAPGAGEEILHWRAWVTNGADWTVAVDPDEFFADVPKIVVSMRRSQQSAIERKRHAGTAMDSIVADDVGTLPDRNIGEAISRIAGVAVDRGDFGEGSAVSVRGNGPGLTRVELDGQAVRAAGGADMTGNPDGRSTEFRQLPADLIKSVDVVKGATADMVEGSLGGGVIIKTRSALDFDKPFASVRVSGTRNSLNRLWDPDTNLLWTRKFLDGRLGVLLNASAIRLTNESHQFQVSSSGRNGVMRSIDFDGSPQKTFTYLPGTVDLADPAATAPWTSFGAWSAATPLDIVTRSAAARTKQDCYAAFPGLRTASAELAGLSTSNRNKAIDARNQELASCLNQWNDTNPALLRYFVKRQVDTRRNLDLRADFKVNRNLTVHAKGSWSRRAVDDNYLAYNLGDVSVNGDASGFVDTNGVRSAVPGSGLSTFPYAYSLPGGGKTLLQGAVANIDPASVVVDANHHVIRYTLQDVDVNNDQIRNLMGTSTRYLQLGGAWKDGPFSADFMAGDMASRFWRGDQRTSIAYVYGDATVTLQPDGIWSYAMPPGTDVDDWRRATALAPAAGPAQPRYTVASPRISFVPQLGETGERTARLDLAYALPAAVPFLRRVQGGYNLRDTASDNWTARGYTVTPAVGSPGKAGYVAAVTVPDTRLGSGFTGCQDTAGSLGPGGTPCRYGVLPVAGTRDYQIVLTPEQFQAAVLGAMTAKATPTSLFSGAAGRPQGLLANWTQIDVARLFASIGARNLDFSCMKQCTGSDGKTYEQPRTSIRERADAAYLTADFGLDRLPFGWELEGNLGMRVVRTRVRGTGLMTFISKLRTAQFNPANPGAAGGTVTTQVTTNTTIAATTRDVLPMLNLALWLVPDTLVARYGLGRAVARPPATKLVPAGSCTYDQTRIGADGGATDDLTCTTVGNPALRAQANVNQNLGVEWYPNKDSMLSASAYRQAGRVGPVQTGSVNGVKLFAGSGVVDPASGQPLSDLPFDYTTYVNGPPATRTGVEVSVKTALTFLPWRLRFLGVDANATRQHSSQQRIVYDLLSGDVLPPAGEPRYSYNWALWYDDGHWQGRVAVQTIGPRFVCIATCGGAPSGYTLNAYPNTGLAAKPPAYNPGPANFVDRTSYVDAKLSYRWNRNVDVFVEARNLTNQTQTTSIGGAPYADGTPNLQSYYYAGRRITVGLNLRFL